MTDPQETPAGLAEVRFRSDVTAELVKSSAADADVLFAARVSTAGEQSLAEVGSDAERSAGLINYLMRDRHGSPFEHNSFTFFVSAPIFVFREFMRHRVGFCLAGDTAIALESDSGPRYTTIADLYRRWHVGVEASVQRDQVRCFNEETLRPQRARILDVIESGAKPLLRLETETGLVVRCSTDHAIFTPDGWRKAGELAAGDYVFGAGFAGVPNPEQALAERDGGAAAAVPHRLALVADDGVEMTYDLSVQGPWHNFLANGIVVHNSYNEESGRYRRLEPVFYVPGPDRKLVQQGKPGRYVFVDGTAEQQKLVDEATRAVCTGAYQAYLEMLEAGIAREVARGVLPVSIYSSMYATCNARALMHFLSLRTKREDSAFPSFPQREIEMVAERMEAIFAKAMPLTYAAFNRNGRVAP